MPILDCGIDIGSTNLKVVFAGEDGRIMHTIAVAAPRIDDGLGPATDPLALVAKLEELIISGWRQVGEGVPLRSLSAAGIGEDGFGVDASLAPLGPAIPWFDRRSAAEAAEMQRRFGDFTGRTGHIWDHVRSASKWLWTRRNRPAELRRAACWMALTDFPAAWWSGKPFMSSSLSARTACFDIHDRVWIEELLAASEAPHLPPVLAAGEVVGELRPGPLRESGAASPRTLLVAGGHDHPVASSMVLRLAAAARVDSMGTANLVYGETPRSRLSPSATLSCSVPPAGEAGVACLGVLELTAMLTQSGSSMDDIRQAMAEPRLAGRPPQDAVELAAAKGEPRIAARRSLERVSLAARAMLSELRQAGVADAPIYATGGWSRSLAFVELRASIYGEPIHALGDVELTAAGAAAYGAGAATGKAVTPLRASDVTVIDPLPAWVEAYDALTAG